MKRFDFVLLLLVISLISASWDIFLQVHLGGFTFRFTQLSLTLLAILTTLYTLKQGRHLLPLGFKSLLLWSSFIILFIPNTPYMSRSILYSIWLLFSVAGIYIFVQMIRTKSRLQVVMRWYIYSFALMGAFGLIQFLAGLVGLNLYTEQWYIPGRLARINGFNYEPSFYAIYMVQGFILTAYLREKKSEIMRRRALNICYLLIVAALVASTSRAGWLICALWLARPFYLFLYHLCKGRFHITYFKKSCLKVFLPLGAAVTSIFVLTHFFSFRYFIAGIGFLGGGSHSSGTRWNEFIDLLVIFMNSPFIGYSLGGLSPAIAALYGKTVASNEEAKSFEGVGVAAQILAASGIIGVIPFLVYLYNILIKPLLLAKRIEDRELKIWLLGMTFSLFFTFIIVQSGQNVLRIYLWYHIALLSSVYAVAKNSLCCRQHSAHENMAARLSP